MSFIDDIIHGLAAPIQQVCPRAPCLPQSAFIVLGAALILSLVAMSANRFLVNYKMIASSRREYMNWMNQVRKARKDGDEKQLEKLMRRQASVSKASFRATMEQFKTYPITIVPFYLIYAVLGVVFGSAAVAFAPFAIPLASITTGGGAAILSLFFWYLICSFTISLPLTRIFGVASAFSMTPTSTDSGDSK